MFYKKSDQNLPILATYSPSGTIKITASALNQDLGSSFSKYIVEQKDPRFTYAIARAVTADVPNKNWDFFPLDEIQRAYPTFIGRNIFLDHNTKSVRNAVGKIIAAELKEDEEGHTYVACLFKVDRQIHPDIAMKIENGIIDSVSMGANVKEAECSVCHHRATAERYFCEHLSSLGQYIDPYTGEPNYSINHGVEFTELSLVSVPADPTAKMHKVFNLNTGINKEAVDLKEDTTNDTITDPIPEQKEEPEETNEQGNPKITYSFPETKQVEIKQPEDKSKFFQIDCSSQESADLLFNLIEAYRNNGVVDLNVTGKTIKVQFDNNIKDPYKFVSEIVSVFGLEFKYFRKDISEKKEAALKAYMKKVASGKQIKGNSPYFGKYYLEASTGSRNSDGNSYIRISFQDIPKTNREGSVDEDLKKKQEDVIYYLRQLTKIENVSVSASRSSEGTSFRVTIVFNKSNFNTKNDIRNHLVNTINEHLQNASKAEVEEFVELEKGENKSDSVQNHSPEDIAAVKMFVNMVLDDLDVITPENFVNRIKSDLPSINDELNISDVSDIILSAIKEYNTQDLPGDFYTKVESLISTKEEPKTQDENKENAQDNDSKPQEDQKEKEQPVDEKPTEETEPEDAEDLFMDDLYKFLSNNNLTQLSSRKNLHSTLVSMLSNLKNAGADKDRVLGYMKAKGMSAEDLDLFSYLYDVVGKKQEDKDINTSKDKSEKSEVIPETTKEKNTSTEESEVKNEHSEKDVTKDVENKDIEDSSKTVEEKPTEQKEPENKQDEKRISLDSVKNLFREYFEEHQYSEIAFTTLVSNLANSFKHSDRDRLAAMKLANEVYREGKNNSKTPAVNKTKDDLVTDSVDPMSDTKDAMSLWKERARNFFDANGWTADSLKEFKRKYNTLSAIRAATEVYSSEFSKPAYTRREEKKDYTPVNEWTSFAKRFFDEHGWTENTLRTFIKAYRPSSINAVAAAMQLWYEREDALKGNKSPESGIKEEQDAKKDTDTNKETEDKKTENKETENKEPPTQTKKTDTPKSNLEYGDWETIVSKLKLTYGNYVLKIQDIDSPEYVKKSKDDEIEYYRSTSISEAANEVSKADVLLGFSDPRSVKGINATLRFIMRDKTNKDKNTYEVDVKKTSPNNFVSSIKSDAGSTYYSNGETFGISITNAMREANISGDMGNDTVKGKVKVNLSYTPFVNTVDELKSLLSPDNTDAVTGSVFLNVSYGSDSDTTSRKVAEYTLSKNVSNEGSDINYNLTIDPTISGMDSISKDIPGDQIKDFISKDGQFSKLINSWSSSIIEKIKKHVKQKDNTNG